MSFASNTTGSNNIGIGYNSGQGMINGSNNTIIGSLNGSENLQNTVLIGAGSTERLKVDASGLYVNGSLVSGSWTFDIVTATTDGNIIVKAGAEAGSRASLLSNDGNNSFWVDNTGAHVVSDFLGAENYWTFGTDGMLSLPNSGTIDDTNNPGTPGIFISRTFQTPDAPAEQPDYWFGTDRITLLLSDADGGEIASYLALGIGVKVWFNQGDSYPITLVEQVQAEFGGNPYGVWNVHATGMGNRFATIEANALIFIYTGATPNTYTNFPQYVPPSGYITLSKGGSGWLFADDGDLYIPPSGTIRNAMTGDDLLAGSVSSLVNGAHTVSLGSTGTLTLPAGGVIAEGGGITGAIRLTPAGGANAYQALVIYPTAAAPDGDHIHLTAGGGSTELYLGNDTHYVKLVDGGNVEVRATTADLSSTAAWTFDTAGNVDARQALGIKVPNGVPSSVSNITMTTGGWELNPNLSLATTGGSGTGLTVNVAETGGYVTTIEIATAGTGYTAGDYITVTSGTSSAAFIIAITGRNSWLFDEDGTTTFPVNTLKTVNGADAVTPGTAGTAGAPLTISAGTGGIAATSLNAGNGGNLTINAGDAGSDIGNPSWGAIGGTLVLRGGNSTQPYNGSNVEIRSGNSASIPGVISLHTGINQWTFGTDGKLTLPDASVIASYKPVTVIAKPATTQTITDAASAAGLVFVESVDSASAFSNGVFTVPYTGYYQFNVSLGFTTNVSISAGFLNISNITSGITILDSVFYGQFSGQVINGSSMLELTAGDTIALFFNQTSGGPVIVSTDSRLTIHRVSID